MACSLPGLCTIEGAWHWRDVAAMWSFFVHDSEEDAMDLPEDKIEGTFGFLLVLVQVRMKVGSSVASACVPSWQPGAKRNICLVILV